MKKKLCLSAIALQTLMLLLCLWLNRPLYPLVNRTWDAKANKNKFAVCITYHRWGTHVACPVEPQLWTERYDEAENRMFLFNGKLESLSVIQKWQAH